MATPDDTGIWPNLLALKDCVCDALEDPKCLCTVVAGSQPPFTGEHDAAWLRVTDSYNTTSFPYPVEDPERDCGAYTVATIEIGVIRCITLNPRNPVLTNEQWLEAARKSSADRAAVRRAILCCDIEDKVLGRWRPITVGLGVGGIWTVQISDYH